MKINKNNYEVYFLDYLEGNLDESLINDFIEFLKENPDLKEELSFYESVSIEPEDLQFKNKELLFKEKYDSQKEFNNAAIGVLEGDISEKEKEEFENYIAAHSEKKNDISLFNKTKLHADESVIFEKKSILYKRFLGRKVLVWSGRIAAVLVLALTIFVAIEKPFNKTVNDNQIVLNNEKVAKKVISPETKQIPEKIIKRETKKPEQILKEPAIKKVKPVQKLNRSLRENSKGRMTYEDDVAIIRTPIETPAKINGLMASLDVKSPKARLATMYITIPDIPEDYYEERLLADAVLEKTGLDKLSLKKISKAGLNFISNISKDKFKYETDEKGKVVNYNFDSRLMAFSIPAKKQESGD